MRAVPCLFLVVLFVVACSSAPAASRQPPQAQSAKATAPWVNVELGPAIGGFNLPVFVAGSGDGRLFVVEQGGLIKIVKDGKVEAQPYLDASKLLGRVGGEQGLLGFAMHPKKDRVYIAYTDKDQDDAFAQYTLKDGKPDAFKVLFAVEDFASNHNGGMIAFGPDGKLWIGTGDGGGGGDPQRTAQDDKSFLGKMLVLDVDTPNAKPVVQYKGLRNPWRYAFDRKTGDLWIADVGQNKWEFVFAVEKARLSQKLNFGWSVVEGAHCFRPNSGCDATGFERVVFEYPHGDDGCSITGGYVYRGTKQPALDGNYFVGDYCSGRIWTIKGGNVAKVLDTKFPISSFGEDDAGEIWVVDHLGGKIHQLMARK